MNVPLPRHPALRLPGADRLLVRLAGTRLGLLAGMLWRDPRHFAEHLALFVVTAAESRYETDDVCAHRHGDQTCSDAAACGDLVGRVARVTRVQGALAGGPFLVLTVVGYLDLLLTRAGMVLRIASLHSPEQDAPAQRAAQLLVLTGAYTDLTAAEAGVRRAARLGVDPLGRRPGRRELRVAVVRAGVLLGLLAPPGERSLRPLRLVGSGAFWAAVFVGAFFYPLAWVPLTAVAYERSTRRLGSRAISFYAEGGAQTGSRPGLSRLVPQRGLLSDVLAGTPQIVLALTPLAIALGSYVVGTTVFGRGHDLDRNGLVVLSLLLSAVWMLVQRRLLRRATGL